MEYVKSKVSMQTGTIALLDSDLVYIRTLLEYELAHPYTDIQPVPSSDNSDNSDNSDYEVHEVHHQTQT